MFMKQFVRPRLTLFRTFASSVQSRPSFPVDRMPLLEELFEAPVLKTEEMTAEALAEVKGFVPPVLIGQVEASLTSEFGRPILETDWSRFEDPTTSYEQAARLLHHTLAIYANVGKGTLQKSEEIQRIADGNQAWIKKECELMQDEIKSGDYSRWEAAEHLLGDLHGKLTEAQLKAIKPALAVISKNAWLHPKTKSEVLAEICRVIRTTIKE